MKMKFKALTMIMVLVLSLQVVTIANAEGFLTEPEQKPAISFVVQPQGRYLDIGRCNISPGNGYVTVWGSTSSHGDI